jgi:hypothetical protein
MVRPECSFVYLEGTLEQRLGFLGSPLTLIDASQIVKARRSVWMAGP